MSDFLPQPYDKKAISYLAANARTIDVVASRLGIAANAIGASMAREITRTQKKSLLSTFGHYVARKSAQVLGTEIGYESQYASDKNDLEQNPGVFDGDYAVLRQLRNHTLIDVGPGSIKVLTAFQIIEQYRETEQGKALGLNKYHMSDLRGIVKDLLDPKKPLSVNIAALVVLNGQNFFNRQKDVAGIAWDKLTDEQKSAALSAYYTLGEHGVSVDMAHNQFFPFTPGPQGGKVGGWVLYGDNYKALKAVLDGRKASAISVAPLARMTARRQSARHSVSVESQAAVMEAAEASPALRIARQMQAAMSDVKELSGSRLSPGLMATVKWTHEIGKGLKAMIQAGAPLSPVLAARRAERSGQFAPGRLAPFHMPSGANGRHASLPSFAPPPRRDGSQQTARFGESTRAVRRPDNAEIPGPTYAPACAPAIDQLQFSEMLSRELDAQARLPPAGPSGFDPRLSPAWPGLKLPN